MGFMMNAANSLPGLEEQRRRRAQFALQQQFDQQALQENTLKLGVMQRQEADIAGERSAMSTAGQGPEFYRKAFEYWKTKDLSKAHAIALDVGNLAKEIQATDPEGSVDFVNKALGTNFKFQGLKDEIMTIKNEDTGETHLVHIAQPRGGVPPKTTDITPPEMLGGGGGGPYHKLAAEEKAAVDADAQEQGLMSGRQFSPKQLNGSLLKHRKDVAEATRRPEGVTNEIELFQRDPEKAQAFMEMNARIKSKFRLDRNPSVAEFMTDLYKKDPETFNGVFNRAAPEKAEDRMLRILQLSKDPITGEIDPGTVEKITNLLKSGPTMSTTRPMLLPSHGNVPHSASQPEVTATNPRTRQRLKLVNGQWVPLN